MGEVALQSRPRVCFEVEKVIGISSDGTYQVQWAPAWVSKFHLVGCEHLIQEFLQRQTEEAKGETKAVFKDASSEWNDERRNMLDIPDDDASSEMEDDHFQSNL